jgi:transposase-like protein
MRVLVDGFEMGGNTRDWRVWPFAEVLTQGSGVTGADAVSPCSVPGHSGLRPLQPQRLADAGQFQNWNLSEDGMRRRYTQEFKQDVVGQSTDKGHPVVVVAERLAASSHSSYKWAHECWKHGVGSLGLTGRVALLDVARPAAGRSRRRSALQTTWSAAS